jgi:hypothetical protein
MTVTLSSDKGSYSGTEVPMFTVEYDPSYNGKDVQLFTLNSITNSQTLINQRKATTSGITTFQYRPPNQGNYIFVARISACYIFFNCESSNKVTISVTGDLPCSPLDPLCNIKGFDYKPILYIAILVLIYLISKELGLFQMIGKR